MRYIISGKVIRGDGYGRKLGFPTVNLDTRLEQFTAGVYAGKGVINHKRYRAAIVINPEGRVEAHLIGFRGDAYKKYADLEIKAFLRKYIQFESEAELIAQIKKDVQQCY